MLSRNQIKHITALHQKKYRQQRRQFIVEGEKIVREVLQQQRFEVQAIWGVESWVTSERDMVSSWAEKLTIVSESELSKISALATPHKVLAVLTMPEVAPDFEALNTGFSFYLDGIQDPSNFGAILRVADWFGIQQVFCSPDSVDVFNPKAIQASMGAFLRVSVLEVPLDDFADKIGTVPVLGAVLDGQNLFQNSATLPRNGLLVMGNEGGGISAKLNQQLTHRITIPRHHTSRTESLNVAVAAGIIASYLINR